MTTAQTRLGQRHALTGDECTMTRPVGVQRIRPAMVCVMVCVQAKLSRWMERAQVRSTGFHVPLMAHGEDRGSPEAGKEAPDSSVSTWCCVLCIEESYSPAEVEGLSPITVQQLPV